MPVLPEEVAAERTHIGKRDCSAVAAFAVFQEAHTDLPAGSRRWEEVGPGVGRLFEEGPVMAGELVLPGPLEAAPEGPPVHAEVAGLGRWDGAPYPGAEGAQAVVSGPAAALGAAVSLLVSLSPVVLWQICLAV